MTTLTEIEEAVSHLSRKDFKVFCDWFENLEAERWEKEFEKDVKNGLLDDLANEAIADFEAGRCKKL